MSVKVIKKNTFDISSVIKSTFVPTFDVSISYPNYLTVASAMADAVFLLKPVMKVTDPKKEKGTFLWFNSNTPTYKFNEKTPDKELKKFNDFYATFKKIHTFREFFAFEEKLQVYLGYTEEDRLALGSNYRIIYNSASGGKSSRCYTPQNTKESLTFMKVIVALANKIRKTIIQLDKSDRETITLENIFGMIIKLVKKTNPNLVISKRVFEIFEATYEVFDEKLELIYMSYIMTGSDLGLFVKLLKELVQHIEKRKGENISDDSDESNNVLFNDLIELLNAIKSTVMKDLSSREKEFLSDEHMEEMRTMIETIDVISDNPVGAIENIARNISL